MAGSGPHQNSPHHAESANVQQQGELHDLKREKGMDNQQEGNLQTLHTGGNGYRRKGHAMHEQGDEKVMQQEIDDLKKRIHRAQRKQSSPSSNVSLMTKKIQATDNDQELHLMSLFPIRRSIFIKEGARVHPGGE